MTSTTLIDNSSTIVVADEENGTIYGPQIPVPTREEQDEDYSHYGGAGTEGGAPQAVITLTVGHTLTPQQVTEAIEALSSIPGPFDQATLIEAVETFAILTARSREKGNGPAVTCTDDLDNPVYNLLDLAGRYYLSDDQHPVARMYDLLLRPDLGEGGIWSFQHPRHGLRYLVVQINLGQPRS